MTPRQHWPTRAAGPEHSFMFGVGGVSREKPSLFQRATMCRRSRSPFTGAGGTFSIKSRCCRGLLPT
jgi:hypothetical protein